MNSLKQTRYFAKNYTQLQGLRAIPLGLCLLLVTIWANRQQGPARNFTLPILAVLAGLILYLLIDRYYNRAYGKVKRKVTFADWIMEIALAGLALAAFIVDTREFFRISLLGLTLAVTFAANGFLYCRPATVLFIFNLVLAAGMALLSLAPMIGISNWWNFLGLNHPLLAITFLFGISVVISGMIGHIYFIRSLPAFQETS